jgi:hypothetical protein
MRNLKLYSFIFLLSFLGASSASAGVLAYAIGQSTGQSNANYEANQKAREEGRISCAPQLSSPVGFWKCEDAYGNQFTDLIITKPAEIPMVRKNARASK